MSDTNRYPTDVRELVAGRLYPTAAVASVCGVGPAAVLRWVASGRLKPALKGDGKRGEFRFYGHSVLSLLLIPVAELPPLEETKDERKRRFEADKARYREACKPRP